MLKKQPHLNVKIKEQQLSQVQSFKYLDVSVDDNVKWDIHIEQMCNKLGKMVSYMSRLRKCINMSELKLIFFTNLLYYLTLITEM